MFDTYFNLLELQLECCGPDDLCYSNLTDLKWWRIPFIVLCIIAAILFVIGLMCWIAVVVMVATSPNESKQKPSVKIQVHPTCLVSQIFCWLS